MSLEERLRQRIQREGPITFCEWMKAALYDEREGYYCANRVRQGRAGDYRTAPEISPLFGGAFAYYFMKAYFDLGAPKEWTIIEVGGGAGDFAHDVLASLQRNFPNIFAATQYVIDELSIDAQSQAITKLAEFKDHVQFRSIAEINEPFPNAIIFSNELLDAFPIHRAIGRGAKLKELCVGVGDRDDFIWVETELSPSVGEYCERIQLRLDEGQVFEVNLGVEDFVRRVALLLERGLLITVDYGAVRNDLLCDPNRFAGTLRTFHRHRLGGDVLLHPGEQDLTTTIDWTQMIEAGEQNGFETLRLERLDQFLLGQGSLDELMNASSQVADTAEFLRLTTSARELILPTGMAASFQVLVQRKRA